MTKAPKKKPLQLQVPIAQFEYLTHLARHTVIGTRETEIASYLLTKAIDALIEQKFHDRPFPRDSGEIEPDDD